MREGGIRMVKRSRESGGNAKSRSLVIASMAL